MSEIRQHLAENARRAGLKIALAATALTGIAGLAPSSTQEAPQHNDTPPAPLEALPHTQTSADIASVAEAPEKNKSSNNDRGHTQVPSFTASPKRDNANRTLPHTQEPGYYSKATPGLPSIEFPEPITTVRDKLVDYHPEKLRIPAAEAQFIAENAVKIPALNCSGLLVRDRETNQPIGFETATHCGLLKDDGHRGIDAAGNPTLDLGRPIVAYLGDRDDNLTAAGEAKQFIFAGDSDMTNDQAYAAFAGHTVEEVMRAAGQKSPEEIQQYQQGDVVYVGMHPAAQPDTVGPNRRQDTPAIVLGTGSIRVANGLRLDVLTVAIPEGVNCTPGASGSVVFDLKDGHRSTNGVASAYTSFDPRLHPDGEEAAREARGQAERRFGVSMKHVSGICSFAFRQPSVENGAVIANVVDVPVYEQTPLNQFERQYTENFFNPDFTRHILKGGTIKIPSPKGGDTFLKDPVYEYDPVSGYVVFGGYNDGSKNGLTLLPVHTESLNMLSVYKNGEGLPHLTDAAGEVTFPLDGQPRHFTDTQNPDGFGEYLNIDRIEGAVSHRIEITDGKLTLHEVTEKGGFDPQTELAQALEDFHDPEIDKVYLQGHLHIPGGLEPEVWLENTVVQATESGGVIASVAGVDGNVEQYYFQSPAELELYGEADGDVAQWHFQNRPAFAADTRTWLDDNGRSFGKILPGRPENLGKQVRLTYQNDFWITEPMD